MGQTIPILIAGNEVSRHKAANQIKQRKPQRAKEKTGINKNILKNSSNKNANLTIATPIFFI